MRTSPQSRFPRFLLICLLIGGASCTPENTQTGVDNTTEPPAGSDVPIDATAARIEVQIIGPGEVLQTPEGAALRLTAIPSEGYQFAGWTGSTQSSLTEIVIVPDQNTLLMALFELRTFDDGDELPAEIDEDQDGVSDEDDQCMATLAGQVVNDLGCSASQRDADKDGVADAVDDCPLTPRNVAVNRAGCSSSQRDSDGDGVTDIADQCPGTTAAALVRLNGCSTSQLDSDDDGVSDEVDQCPGTTMGDTVGALTGCPAGTGVCGNGIVDSGEECEPPASATCSAACRRVIPAPANNTCATRSTLATGSNLITNRGATTDGSGALAGDCIPAEFINDVWYCWTATCTGAAAISTCGAEFDSVVAVYTGCTCPTSTALACNDDGCGAAGGGSNVTFAALAGQSYLVRLGSAATATGGATLLLSCTSTCGNNLVDVGEQCEPPNTATCGADCRLRTASNCGNNMIEAGEQCDPPNQTTCGCNCRSVSAAAPVCGNCIVEEGESCDPPNATSCGSNCVLLGLPMCGNSALEGNEECDPPNSITCNSQCRLIRPGSDVCASATAVTDGQFAFTTVNSSNDAPPGALPECGIRPLADIWYCYTATCSGRINVELCGGEFDATLFVYDGCGCPAANRLVCGDDECIDRLNPKFNFESVVNQQYLLRVGGYLGVQGVGRFMISCTQGETCGPGNGNCFQQHANPGCEIEACCDLVCNIDPFCCQGDWDVQCAVIAGLTCPQ